MHLRRTIISGVKTNLFFGGVYSVISGLFAYALIRTLPARDFAAYASVLAASNIVVVLMEGGLSLGFTRHLAAARREGVSASLYAFVVRRRVLAGVFGMLALAGWSALGWGHHSLLDGHIGRWVWLSIGLIFFGELFALLPLAGLQALFEYQKCLSVRTLFVVGRGTLIIGGYLWTQNLYLILTIHGVSTIAEGCVYHFLLSLKLSDKGLASVQLRQDVKNYGYFSIAEKGAHAIGGINGFFLILGYFLTPSAMGPLAIAKELAQRGFSLVILPINNLTTGILNCSTDSPNLRAIASKSFVITSIYVLLVSGLGLGVINTIIPALKRVDNHQGIATTVVIFSGITVECVLRYDQSYRFRLGQMLEATAWAYSSTIVAIALSIGFAAYGSTVALIAYFVGRLLILSFAVAFRLMSRYDSSYMKWLPVMLAAYALTIAALLWREDAYWHWLPLTGVLATAWAFGYQNRSIFGWRQLFKRKRK
jgi:hypothetical protein